VHGGVLEPDRGSGVTGVPDPGCDRMQGIQAQILPRRQSDLTLQKEVSFVS
jgi:hypothetical protein